MDSEASLIMQGFYLSAVGMATVFVFLTSLVLATALMSHLIVRFSPAAKQAATSNFIDATDQGRTVAIVTAAIHAHRTRTGQQ